MKEAMRRVRVGVDAGGTFTDAVVVEEDDEGIARVVAVKKLPSTPDSPARAPVAGVRALLDARRPDPRGEDLQVAHGTTVATNAVIERTGAKTCLLVTKGFRDLLEIGRLHRGREMLYDLRYLPPEPIVRRASTFEVDERICFDGSVERPLEPSEVERIVAQVAAGAYESVAICLLFSFVNPAHEEALVESITARLPAVHVAASHVVLPEVREYERAATTTISAYVGPVITKYATVLMDEATNDGVKSQPHVMQSNGGLTSMRRIERNAAGTLLSGPAAGVTGAAAVGAAYGFENLVTADMGGTSFDVGLVADGEVLRTVDKKFLQYPIRLPMVDVETIGAGGGSIAWVDATGVFRVGPRSAGAVPGPACYGKGGTEATVSDADLHLGLLDPENFVGGEFALYPDLAQAALERLGATLGMSASEAARAVHDLVVANMAGAIRLVSIQRGFDCREFTLVAFGGAGPTHAVAIAAELGITRVLIPRYPGVMSAVGLCCADVKYDYVESIGTPARELSNADLGARARALVGVAEAELVQDGFPVQDRHFVVSLEARYAGQGFVIDVPVDDLVEDLDVGAIEGLFHKLHAHLHGFADETLPIEFLALRVAATGAVGVAGIDERAPDVSETPERTRAVEMPGASGTEPVRVMDRAELRPGETFDGPVVIEQHDTTTIVPRGCKVTVLAHGDLEVIVPNEEGATP
jgi:N-methylhydantoinase A